MARRDLTVWCGIFDDLQLSGLCTGRIKLNGAPFYVFQVRAMPPQKWVGKILRKGVEPLVVADTAEGVKLTIEKLCATKILDWREGYWNDDIWQPKTSRPAPLPIKQHHTFSKAHCTICAGKCQAKEVRV